MHVEGQNGTARNEAKRNESDLSDSTRPVRRVNDFGLGEGRQDIRVRCGAGGRWVGRGGAVAEAVAL